MTRSACPACLVRWGEAGFSQLRSRSLAGDRLQRGNDVRALFEHIFAHDVFVVFRMKLHARRLGAAEGIHWCVRLSATVQAANIEWGDLPNLFLGNGCSWRDVEHPCYTRFDVIRSTPMRLEGNQSQDVRCMQYRVVLALTCRASRLYVFEYFGNVVARGVATCTGAALCGVRLLWTSRELVFSFRWLGRNINYSITNACPLDTAVSLTHRTVSCMGADYT